MSFTARLAGRASALLLSMLAATSAARADITIGVSLSLTGPLSSLGIPVKSSLALWPERIAGERLNLIVLDDASDTTQAVNNARRFIVDSKADLIVGSSGVPAVLALAPVAAEAKTVQLALAPVPRPGGAGDWTLNLPKPITLMADTLARRMAADRSKNSLYAATMRISTPIPRSGGANGGSKTSASRHGEASCRRDIHPARASLAGRDRRVGPSLGRTVALNARRPREGPNFTLLLEQVDDARHQCNEGKWQNPAKDAQQRGASFQHDGADAECRCSSAQ